MWRLLAVLVVVAVAIEIVETVVVAVTVLGAVAVVGYVLVRLTDRTPMPSATTAELVPCCDYRDHEGEAAVCGCTGHPRSHIHPFGLGPLPA
ncbi:hypothetical protein E9549_03605 [Blastococcus sp. MG754426]|uniref:hypothetical protein n=1 Tax=unclassified Blastococcus TaxID=2619396 RepID=UPI001EF08322|nr:MULTISPECIES: hypothetical protein [unclassified Blastococcus]MCF6506497.1 hypothetical protein [Blastococcus sp. MG754426]MCF6511219.1 hypothetical protein [Blastococcus sp. MG754427]MCF6734495.1 hypothetical protein [Blastococcus sp. KM273129]